MNLPTIDNSDATFDEDMAYLRMLTERIFRTAVNTDADLTDMAEKFGMFVRDGEVVGTYDDAITAGRQAIVEGSDQPEAVEA